MPLRLYTPEEVHQQVVQARRTQNLLDLNKAGQTIHLIYRDGDPLKRDSLVAAVANLWQLRIVSYPGEEVEFDYDLHHVDSGGLIDGARCVVVLPLIESTEVKFVFTALVRPL